MKKTVITLIDDLDPEGETLADETVMFGLDGKWYEIDLTAENAHRLRARLKEFIQAGRLAGPGSRPSRPTRPMTEAAGDGATLSRHQGGVDPVKAREWAIEQGIVVPTRGRLPKKIKDAYSSYEKFGDKSRLEKLLQEQGGSAYAPIPEQDEEDPGAPEFLAQEASDKDTLATVHTLRPQSDPAPKENKTPATDKPAPDVEPVGGPATTSQEQQHDSTEPDDDPAEAKAREYYVDLKKAGKLSDIASKDGYWEKRTAGGLKRTDRVEKMTLVERIEILTGRNLTVLSKLAGINAPDGPGKISFLSQSVARLENLEVIVQDPTSEFGWSITRFGRYALSVRKEAA